MAEPSHRPSQGQSEEITVPFPSSEFERILDEYQGQQQLSLQSGQGQSEQSTEILVPYSKQQESNPSSASPLNDLRVSEDLADIPLDQLLVRWDPQMRLVFKRQHDLTVCVSESDLKTITILFQPTANSGQPFPVELVGCIQGKCNPMLSVQAGSVECSLYYIPNSDDMVIYNRGALLDLHHLPTSQTTPNPDSLTQLPTDGRATLTPGIWHVSSEYHDLEFRLWPRSYSIEIEEKRVLGRLRSPEEDTTPAAKRRRTEHRLPSAHTSIPLSLLQEGETTRVAYRLTDDKAWFDYSPADGQIIRIRDRYGQGPEYGFELAFARIRYRQQAILFQAELNTAMSDSPSSRAVMVKTFRHPREVYAQEDNKQSMIMKLSREWLAEFKPHHLLDHPHIARLLHYDARTLSLFIEFHNHPDLGSYDWCNNGGLFRGGHADACRILAHLSSALLYLESHGIVHNDIKPANIVYGGDSTPELYRAILIDFGLAQEHAEPMMWGGTPWYIPAEFATGTRSYPADVWSLGIVMLYLRKHIKLPEKVARVRGWELAECRRGRVPEQMSQWLERIRKSRSDLRANCARNAGQGCEIDRIICKMLEDKAVDRITGRELEQQAGKWAK